MSKPQANAQQISGLIDLFVDETEQKLEHLNNTRLREVYDGMIIGMRLIQAQLGDMLTQESK